MIQRFLHTCLFGLLVLLGALSSARAQKDTISFIPNAVFDSVVIGTVRVDTIGLKITGSARTIYALTSDQNISVVAPAFPRVSTAGIDSFAFTLQVSPSQLGLYLTYIVVTDSAGSFDTLKVYMNGLAQTNFTVTDTVRVGPLLLGGTVFESFKIFSAGGDLIIDSIRSIGESDSVNLLGPQLPAVIPQGDSISVPFSLTAKELGPHLFHFLVKDSTGLTRFATITVEGVEPSNPDSTFILDPSRHDAFAAVTDKTIETFSIKIRNTQNNPISVDSIIFDPSPFFKLSFLPDTSLQPGEELKVNLELNAVAEGFYKTYIHVPSDGGLASEYTLGIQVLRIAKNSVPVVRTGSGIRVTQSATSLGIEDIPFETGSLEIYDLLGRPIAHHDITANELLIPKLDTGGMPIPDGCYILRLLDSYGRYNETIKVLLLSY